MSLMFSIYKCKSSTKSIEDLKTDKQIALVACHCTTTA